MSKRSVRHIGRPPKFDSRLRAKRAWAGRTLEQVAGSTGLSAPTVARAEAGRNISLRTIDALVGYYGRSVLRLLVRPP